MIYQFDEITLDTERLEVTRDGQTIPVKPEICTLLAHLIDNRERVLSKDELTQAVWADQAISKNALTTAVSSARRAVGDSGRAQAVIKTFANRGYQFVAVIGEPQPTAEPEKPEPAAPKPSIAVLPFVNLSGDPEQEYFSDGVAGDIIERLSHIQGLFVVARNSSFTIKGALADRRQIADEMGVRYLLEGSARKTEDRINISAQLFDGQTGLSLWTNSFEHALNQVFAVEDEIADTVMAAILPGEQTTRARKSHILNAWDLFQHATYSANLGIREASEEALDTFKMAAQMDPTYAAAHAGLALIFHRAATQKWSDDLEMVHQNALAAARRAVELDPDCSSASAILGALLASAGGFDAAEPVLSNAIAINPNNGFAHLWRGMVNLYRNDGAAALPNLEMALRLSPRDPSIGEIMAGIAEAHLRCGDFDQAAAYVQRSIRHPSAGFHHHAILVSAFSLQGRRIEARHAANELIRQWPEFTCSWYQDQAPPGADISPILDGLKIARIPM